MAIVGIDLGTTHSLVGVFEPGGPRLLPNALGQWLTPSVVSVDESGAVLVGQAAKDRLVSHPDCSVAAFKRWMGSRHEVRLGSHRFLPEELSALVLRSLIADAEAALGEKVEEAVVSVPAYFSDAQRKATQAAGVLAGIKVERLINEPTAAALSYGLENRGDGTRFVVCDLGGGTFDVTILEMFDGVVEVHATAGDNFLGGEDFLEVLVQAFCADQGVQAADLAPRELGVIRHRCETLKRRLSEGNDFSLEIPLNGGMVPWRMDVNRFEQLCEPLLQRLRLPLERALRDAQLKPADLDEVILVGGASRMPQVVKLATRLFGRLPLRHIKPDESIALGAAVAAGLKARHAALEEVILTDVCPYTLGTEVARSDGRGGHMDGFFHPIIPRNCTVPVSREDRFYPVNAEQRLIQVGIYQGESPRVEKNIKLGELSVPLPERHGDEDAEVVVRFTYDVNGVLQVEATVTASGQRHEVILQQQAGRLSDEEIRQRLAALAALKIHPRDKQENLALVARAERLYEEVMTAREFIQHWLGNFQHALESQDEAAIATLRQTFAKALDEVEMVER